MHRNNPDIHHRYSVRLRGYDYRQHGVYAVTLCTKNRECLFGEIRGGKMTLSTYGRIAEESWLHVLGVLSYIDLDAFVVMPNHIHGILHIKPPNDACRGVTNTQRICHAPTKADGHILRAPLAGSLGSFIRSYKAAVTKRIRFLPGGYDGSIWQRNYHEHIIRTPLELMRYRKYILDNPGNWTRDEEHPASWE